MVQYKSYFYIVCVVMWCDESFYIELYAGKTEKVIYCVEEGWKKMKAIRVCNKISIHVRIEVPQFYTGL